MPDPVVTVRVSPAAVERLKAFAEARGLRISDVAREALEAHLGNAPAPVVAGGSDERYIWVPARVWVWEDGRQVELARGQRRMFRCGRCGHPASRVNTSWNCPPCQSPTGAPQTLAEAREDDWASSPDQAVAHTSKARAALEGK